MGLNLTCRVSRVPKRINDRRDENSTNLAHTALILPASLSRNNGRTVPYISLLEQYCRTSLLRPLSAGLKAVVIPLPLDLTLSELQNTAKNAFTWPLAWIDPRDTAKVPTHSNLHCHALAVCHLVHYLIDIAGHGLPAALGALQRRLQTLAITDTSLQSQDCWSGHSFRSPEMRRLATGDGSKCRPTLA